MSFLSAPRTRDEHRVSVSYEVIQSIEIECAASGTSQETLIGLDPTLVSVRIARLNLTEPSRAYQQSACQSVLNELLRMPAFSAAHIDQATLNHSESGSPRLLVGGAPSGINLSMAHSGRWVAVALAKGARVGVDVERARPRENFVAMAEYMGWKDRVDNLDDFLTQWTIWEACVKLSESSIFARNNAAFVELRDIEPDALMPEYGPWTGMRMRISDKAYFALAIHHACEATLVTREKNCTWKS